MHALPVPWVEVSDISNAMVFLCSDEARYITGETLAVAAGSNAKNAG
jgi:enoyl-[acyl-carrier-protein] reductase (NADH)